MILWLIGISGAGKTTIGSVLVEKLRARGRRVIFIDGDEIRDVWSDSLGHSMEARRTNHTRLSKLCAVLDQDDVDIIVSALSIFPDLRHWNRKTFRNYVEVFLDLPVDEAARRDPKQIYARRARGEARDVVGIDFEFPVDGTTDLTIAAPEVLSTPNTIASRILTFLDERSGSAKRYRYTGRDLFDAPETYEFAPCEDADFFAGWQRHRSEIKMRLMDSTGCAFPPEPSILNQTAASPPDIPNQGALTHIMDALVQIARNETTTESTLLAGKAVMDTFVKKFEIFRRLFERYQSGYRKFDGASEASAEEYFSFAGALIAYHDRTGVPIYTSTLLKLTDAMLSRWSDTNDTDMARKLCATLEAESQIVAHWERHTERADV